jgi:hypothetical protein
MTGVITSVGARISVSSDQAQLRKEKNYGKEKGYSCN